MQKIVKKGTWDYSNGSLEKVMIIEQDWDELFEEGYSEGDPYLNDSGLVYFIHFGDYSYNEYGNIVSGSISIPFLSLDEAEKYAEQQVSHLEWDTM